MSTRAGAGGGAKSALPLVVGFASPTLCIVLAIHVAREPSWGEALDGLASGLWFSLLFAAGALLGVRGAREAYTRAAWTPGLLAGMLAALLVWSAFWGFWTLVPHPEQPVSRGSVFVVHSILMAVAGLAVAHGRRASV